jgi:hypothetical protein
MRGHEGCDAFQISAVSHAVSTLSGAQHDSAAFQPQPNGESPAKMRRPQSKLIPKLAFLALKSVSKLEEECVI